MKVLCVKTGRFSFHPVNGPIFDCIDGKIVDLTESQANQLLRANWAESMASVRDKEKPPWKRKEWDAEAKDAKQQLIDYASDLFEVSLDKRKSVKTLIKDIKRLIDQND